MKLATLKTHERDGVLVVVSKDLQRCQKIADIATLQYALDHWQDCAPKLQAVYDTLNANENTGEAFDEAACHSPLPRAYQWADGSAYINHVELVRKARGASVPESFYEDPLMYQGGSDSFLAPHDDITAHEDWGIDLEAEVAVITGDVPLGASADEAAKAIRLVMLVNDVSLRNLIPDELAKGFGFFQSKPASAFSPVAVTPDELTAWQGSKLHLPLVVHINDKPFGKPNAGTDMTFDFGQLIAHAAKTRNLAAGTIIGSGTVSNKQDSLWGSSIEHGGVGYCCLAELRMYESIESKAQTPFLKHGDTVRIEMFDENHENIFGTIKNTVNAINRQA
ncbi:2-keto-4-pentenoate hydratase [Moraxella caviae]|uniref:2-keto-4-pentenoate hydratase n=1 Tax=Moraxella caviae TaxID=34060 RepID=A0A1T0A1F1_9GAMM|nr:fumarylacetoacetate hydrolase family protein [Moraxella caviae]OOR89570.1 2-keto-4-pentenoate hydratase [Moraxella caviae]STZ10251.1 2-keto-4-pentenoate hydratase/2-oxohepta-3-ene-1,7-dioic acid hydratase (catechol pathway) [Moraxella caviae]VEW13246.1 2-keto-4-pentenoate hydratase/2-oxohepta-3-ene-1,7-dioic acid hydratase (catechol pathway) [Moraxella caviae]